MVLGLVGGVASGKSSVAQIFASERATTRVDADSIARRVLRQPSVRKALRKRFPGLLLRDGSLDRGKLAQRVFSDPSELRALEAILHPPIRRSLERAIRGAKTPYVLVDAPLLQETGADRLCDEVIYVHCPARVRRDRAFRSRGWLEEEHRAREANQWSLRRKRAGARFVVDNGNGRDRARRQVRAILRRLERRR